jgi:anti-anti-sigma factor
MRVHMSTFSLQRQNCGEVQVLSFNGSLDNDASCRVAHVLAHLHEQHHRRVILDLARLSSATTMSLARLLVSAREFHRHGGELKLAGMSSRLARAAELAGFDRGKDFAPDVATALKAMAPGSETTVTPAAPRQATRHGPPAGLNQASPPSHARFLRRKLARREPVSARPPAT